MLACLPLLLFFTAPAEAADSKVDADTVLARARHAYRLAPAYRAEGMVTSHIIDADKGRETTLSGRFTMQLGRPRLYRITWSQQVDSLPSREGAVWNAGEGPRLLQAEADTCSALADDRLALAAATGVSMGVANFIPHLFFDLGKDTDSLSRLKEATYETDAEMDGRTCHVIRGTASDTITVRLWIDASTYEIRRIENAFGGSPRIDLTPEDEAEALRAAGREVNEANRRAVRSALAKARAALGNVKGRTIQEHRGIDMIGVPGEDSYEVPLPEGVMMVEGLSDTADLKESP